ncbi:TonB-dependent receptor plug domain-containing protein [Formosa algae]|uniref:Outer membrane cobalamin receptor n=2 Tax=Formosa algae TaxID=225843 RepID=A0A9X0YJC7_9FLAO|nr:TonB-dependent receptor [Formosa algae]MBP1839650.1 outer membrane cobalamin receptor [Formosa algae]MDQ0334954.1 outer membrane cobalamin receptor [Formosa algae]
MRFFKSFYCNLFIGCLLSWSAMAQDKDSVSTTTLNEVVLKYNVTQHQAHVSPVPVQTLNSETLAQLNSLNVADAIRFFSGVQLKDYGGVGGLKTVNIRSMGSQHTAVFYDGVRLGNAQNGQVDLGKYSLNNMEEISLYQGQRTDLDQSANGYASANTMYLKSKTPKFSNLKNYEAEATVKTGSFGLFNPSLAVDYKLNDNIAARVSAEMVSADGEYEFQYTNGSYDTTAVRENADIKSYRVEAALYGNPSGKSSWHIKYYHFDSERGLPGAIVANVFSRPQRLWDQNNFIQGEFKHKVNDSYFFVIRGKYASDHSRYVDPEIVSLDGILDNKYFQKTYYASVVNTLKIKPFWEISLASDFEENTLDANLYRFAYPKRFSMLNALASNLYFKGLNVQLSVLSTTVNETVEAYDTADDLQEFTPSVMVNVQPLKTPDLRLRAFYKNSFRMPTFNDLYYTFVGNTYLKPEYSEQINFGFSYQHAKQQSFFEVQADVYKIWITDKIVAVPGTNLFRWTMLNLDTVETTGLEVGLKSSFKLSNQFNLTSKVNYTYQEAIDVTPDSNTYGDQIPYIPLHSGSATVMAMFKDFKFNYSFIYTGGRYSQKANINSNYLEPWYTHDLSANYNLRLFKKSLQFGLEVNNVLDQQYAVIKNFPMPGRSYRFTLNYKL